MRILYLTQLLPFPPDSGGKVKTLTTLKALAKKHQIFLLSFVDKKEDRYKEVKLEKFCFGIKTLVQPVVFERHKAFQLQQAFFSLFSSKPYTVYKYFSSKMKEFFKKTIKKYSFDCLWIDYLAMAQYLPDDFIGKKILEEHNISSIYFERCLKIEGNILKKIFLLIESLKWRKFEKIMIPKFDQILAISPKDRKILRTISPKTKTINTLPMGIDMGEFKLTDRLSLKEKNLLFIGALSWFPNRDGFFWFYKNVFPWVRGEVKNVKLYVVGASPSEEIKKIGKKDPNVVITGYVKDIRSYLTKANVFIAPLRAGSGIRIKILHALAMGVPVVSTTIGAEGIGVRDGQNILLADTSLDFAKMVIRIFRDKNLRQKLKKEGRKLIKKQYSAKILMEKLNELIKN